MRGLIEVTANTREIINEINRQQKSAVPFRSRMEVRG